MMKKKIAYIYIYDLEKEKHLENVSLLPEEQAKAHKSGYRLSRELIRRVLAIHDIPSEDFFYQPSGQPCLKNKFSISLSHCKKIFIIALMESEKLGVDIQTYFMKNASGFKKKFQLIHMQPTELLSHWTKVEAYCKATQSTLMQSLYPSIDQKIIDNQLCHWATQSPYNIALISDQPFSEIHLIHKDLTRKYYPDPIEYR